MTKEDNDNSDQEPSIEAQNSWQIKAEEYLTGWKRTQADFENYRRRTEEQRAEWLKLTAAESLLRVAPILDDFKRAFSHVPDAEQNSAWVGGMQQVEKNLRSLLSQSGLVPIEDAGDFDPNLHEAIAYEEHPELPDGKVIEILETGWKLGKKIIKPARVRVSKGQTKHHKEQ